MKSLSKSLRSIRIAHATRGDSTVCSEPFVSPRDEIRNILRGRSIQRWDAPLTDIIRAMARFFSVANSKTMHPDVTTIKRMFDMDVEHVPQFMMTELNLSHIMAKKWCDILWMNRMDM